VDVAELIREQPGSAARPEVEKACPEPQDPEWPPQPAQDSLYRPFSTSLSFQYHSSRVYEYHYSIETEGSFITSRMS
jgi:hypothetical protein